MNNVFYRIQLHAREKMMVVYLDRLAPHLEATKGWTTEGSEFKSQ
jgi:hypothetical protein